MVGDGTLWVRMSMLFNPDKYPNGIPTPRFLLKGASKMYDPRSDQYGYSNNAALVILYVLKEYMNLSDDEIIWTGFGGFTEAANLCDEIVTNPDESTEKRYTLNGSFLLDETPGDVLTDLLTSCGADLVRIAGKVGLLPAAYYGPATFTVTESDIVSDIEIQPEPERSKATNVVGGQFIDPTQNYVETDFPVVKDEEAIARDGEEIQTDLDLRFVTSPYQAQRLANITLKRAKAGATLKFTMNLKGFYCRRGRVVSLDVPSLGLSGEYRVIGMDCHIQEGVTVTLIQEDIDIYDDAVGSEFVSPSIPSLPIGGVAAPTSVQFLAESVGDVIQGTLVWQTRAPNTNFNEILIEKYLEDNSTTTVKTGQAIGNSFDLNGLTVANYKASVRSVNSSGKSSDYASANFIVDTPTIPDNVDINRSNWSINLVPNFSKGVPVGTLFEFWHLSDPASYIASPPTYSNEDQAQSKKIHTGSSFNHSGLVPDRWQHYWIRTVNLYGESGFIYIKTGTTKEQDLVTTVVERLQAIEIESQNWDDQAGTGYKLFSPTSSAYVMPDGTVVKNPDGLVVFNNAVVKGHIVAQSMSFVGEIPPEIDNSNVDAGGSETYRQDTAPTDPSEGDVWYNTADSNKSYVYQDGKWEDVSLEEFNGNINVEESSDNVGLKITNQSIIVYDESGNLRVKIGKL